jgi:hypothetical protein
LYLRNGKVDLRTKLTEVLEGGGKSRADDPFVFDLLQGAWAERVSARSRKAIIPGSAAKSNAGIEVAASSLSRTDFAGLNNLNRM